MSIVTLFYWPCQSILLTAGHACAFCSYAQPEAYELLKAAKQHATTVYARALSKYKFIYISSDFP